MTDPLPTDWQADGWVKGGTPHGGHGGGWQALTVESRGGGAPFWLSNGSGF